MIDYLHTKGVKIEQLLNLDINLFMNGDKDKSLDLN